MPPVAPRKPRDELSQFLFQAIGCEIPEFLCAIYQDDHEGDEYGTYWFSEQTAKFFGKDITDELFKSLKKNYIVLGRSGTVIGIDEGMNSDLLTQIVNALIEYARQMATAGRYEPDPEIMEITWGEVGFPSRMEEGLSRGAFKH